jgi:hypothetical protein
MMAHILVEKDVKAALKRAICASLEYAQVSARRSDAQFQSQVAQGFFVLGGRRW